MAWGLWSQDTAADTGLDTGGLLAPPQSIVTVASPPAAVSFNGPDTGGLFSAAMSVILGTSTTSGTYDFTGDWLRPICEPGFGRPPEAMKITLPNDEVVTMIHDGTDSSVSGACTWRGGIDGEPMSRAIITRLHGSYVGVLFLDSGAWQIRGTYPDSMSIELLDETLVDDTDGDISTDTGDTALDTGTTALAPAGGHTSSITGYPPDYGDKVIVDILATYTEDMRIKAGGDPLLSSDEDDAFSEIANAIAITNDALENSQVDAWIRVIGHRKVDIVSANETVCGVRSVLNQDVGSDGLTTNQYRTQLGADLTIGFFDNLGGAGGGCSGTNIFEHPVWDTSSTDTGDYRALPRDPSSPFSRTATVEFASFKNSTRHELGHLFGLCHAPENKCSEDDMVERYAFGHFSPSVDHQFSTIMSKTGSLMPCTSSGAGPNCPRRNFYSNPEVTWPADIDTAQPPMPMGSRSRSSSGPWFRDALPGDTGVINGKVAVPIANRVPKAADAARALREHIPIIAAIEDPNLPIRSTLTAPAQTQSIGGTVSFTWIDAGATSYVLEMDDGSGTFSVVPPYQGTGLSHTFTGVPTSGPLFVRLWTESDTDIWLHREYRYNHLDEWISCADEAASVVPGSTSDDWVCQPDGDDICIQDTATGTLTCDLGQGQPWVSNSWIRAVSLQQETPQIYDLMARGRDSLGRNFCCLYADHTQQMDQLILEGSNQRDLMYFRDTYMGHQLTAGDSHAFQGEIRGRYGDDHIVGSSSLHSNYNERLLGQSHDDLVFGNGGNDELLGWYGDDSLWGGDGNDVLLPGEGNDSVVGGDGWDTICTENPSDLVLDSTQYFELNLLYISKVNIGSDTINPSTNMDGLSLCGHTDHGTGWGNCAIHTLTGPPAVCATHVQP